MQPIQKEEAKKKASDNEVKLEDEIEEDIEQQEDEEVEEKDNAGVSGSQTISQSAVGIDKSIDTLNLEEYDYVEEIKVSPK